MGSGSTAAVRPPALPAVHEPHPWEERRDACGHLGHDDTAVDGVEGVAHVDREDHAAQLLRRALRLWVEQVEADSLRDRLARAGDANANLLHLEQDVGDLWLQRDEGAQPDEALQRLRHGKGPETRLEIVVKYCLLVHRTSASEPLGQK